jgi:hypothetical protein
MNCVCSTADGIAGRSTGIALADPAERLQNAASAAAVE